MRFYHYVYLRQTLSVLFESLEIGKKLLSGMSYTWYFQNISFKIYPHLVFWCIIIQISDLSLWEINKKWNGKQNRKLIQLVCKAFSFSVCHYTSLVFTLYIKQKYIKHNMYFNSWYLILYHYNVPAEVNWNQFLPSLWQNDIFQTTLTHYLTNGKKYIQYDLQWTSVSTIESKIFHVIFLQ